MTKNVAKRGFFLVAVLAPLPSLIAQTLFVPLGYLDGSGPTSEANAITPDGTKIVGYSTTSLTQNLACWWTTAGIAVVPGVQNWLANSAYGVSADGNVIVGDRSFGGTEEAWYWTPVNQSQLIPFPEVLRASTARGVSGDGQIVVGIATTVDSNDTKFYKAFRWDRRQATATYLPPYSSTFTSTGAYAVSDDGRRAVGSVQTSLSTQAAARWDDGAAPVLFSKIGDTIVAVTANAISADGSVVVGAGVNVVNGKGVAFKWTAAGGVVALQNPTDGVYAILDATADDVSGNGRVVVGYGENARGDKEAIFWLDEKPFRVSSVAFKAGVLPPDWEPFTAYGTDYTGNSICGYGRASSGKLEAYVLIINSAPPTPPPIVAPTIRPSFNRSNGTFSIRFPTVAGLRYRIHGGNDVRTLKPLRDWRAGAGAEQEFSADSTVTGGATSFFLRVEVAN